jgi:hypothetical protein
MATTAQMYYEIARILRVTRNNVEYEAERNKSQLLCDVAKTLGNLSTLVGNISTEVRALELSHKKESEQETANESSAFAITFAYLIKKGYADDFMAYLKERESKSGTDFIMKRFTTQL